MAYTGRKIWFFWYLGWNRPGAFQKFKYWLFSHRGSHRERDVLTLAGFCFLRYKKAWLERKG